MNAHLAELGRVIVVSILALLVDAGTLALLVHGTSLPYQLAGFLGFMAGLTVNYALSVSWAFQKRRITDRRLEFLLFTSVGLLGAGWNALFLWLGVEVFEASLLLAKMVSVGLVFFWNYGVRKYSLFTKV